MGRFDGLFNKTQVTAKQPASSKGRFDGLFENKIQTPTSTQTPKRTSGSPFNPNTPGHDEFVKQMDQRAGSTSTAKNFVSSIPGAFKTAGKIAAELPKSLVTQYTKPSETEQQIEQQMPNKGIGKMASTLVKPVFRTVEPFVTPIASQIGTAIGTKGKVLPSANEAFLAGGAFGIGAAGSFVGAEAGKGKPVYQEKTPFIKSSEPILFKDSTIAPKVSSAIKAPVSEAVAPEATQVAKPSPKPVVEPSATPSEAIKAGQEVSYPKTTKGGKLLKPITYKPIEEAPLQTPEIKTSKLAQGVEARAIQKKLADGFEGLPEYAKVNVADQAKAASTLLKTNRDQAINIAMGHEKPPEGILPESVFVAVEDHAIKTKDVALLRDLATSSSLPSEATGMGQRIRMLAERDPNSAVGAMQKVVELREEAATRKYGDIGKAKASIANEIATEMKKAAPKAKDWSSFIDQIKCT